MSTEIVLEGKLETEKDFIGYCEMLQELAQSWKLKMETFESFALIDVCPEGYVEIGYEDGYLSISAQTNVAGPGFHAYVCELFDAIITKSPIELAVSDPSNYFSNRNFDNLKTQVFERWLEDVAKYIVNEHKDEASLCISWPLDYYKPEGKENFVVTPMGYIAIDDFKNIEVKQLAQRFFIWNEKGRTATYYRNAALNLLWKECYFEYSNMNEYTEKMADTILDYLEIAHELDKNLLLPMHEYESLCTILNREKKIQDATTFYIKDIGYRSGIVDLQFGNWSIPSHGCCEKSIDESTQTLYLMAPYKSAEEPWDWMIKANAYAFKQSIETFLADLDQAEAIEHIEVSHDDIQGKAILEKKDDHFLLTAQLNVDKEMLLIQYIICDEIHINTLKEQLQKIKHHSYANDALKN